MDKIGRKIYETIEAASDVYDIWYPAINKKDTLILYDLIWHFINEQN